MGFSHCTLLGDLLHVCVTCCPDTGFAIATMVKFLTQPSGIHHKCLKGIATHLQCKREWGIRHKLNPSTGLPSIDLADGDFSGPPMPLPEEPSPFPSLANDPTAVCFVDGTHTPMSNQNTN